MIVALLAFLLAMLIFVALSETEGDEEEASERSADAYEAHPRVNALIGALNYGTPETVESTHRRLLSMGPQVAGELFDTLLRLDASPQAFTAATQLRIEDVIADFGLAGYLAMRDRFEGLDDAHPAYAAALRIFDRVGVLVLEQLLNEPEPTIALFLDALVVRMPDAAVAYLAAEGERLSESKRQRLLSALSSQDAGQRMPRLRRRSPRRRRTKSRRTRAVRRGSRGRPNGSVTPPSGRSSCAASSRALPTGTLLRSRWPRSRSTTSSKRRRVTFRETLIRLMSTPGVPSRRRLGRPLCASRLKRPSTRTRRAPPEAAGCCVTTRQSGGCALFVPGWGASARSFGSPRRRKPSRRPARSLRQSRPSRTQTRRSVRVGAVRLCGRLRVTAAVAPLLERALAEPDARRLVSIALETQGSDALSPLLAATAEEGCPAELHRVAELLKGSAERGARSSR